MDLVKHCHHVSVPTSITVATLRMPWLHIADPVNCVQSCRQSIADVRPLPSSLRPGPTRRPKLTRQLPRNYSYGWHFQYLTIISLLLSLLTFLVALLSTLLPSVEVAKPVQYALSAAATPLAVLVSILYWTLRTVCHLVLPQRYATVQIQ